VLIAHQGEIEGILAAFFGQTWPEIVGNESLVAGTKGRADWLRGMRTALAVEDAMECRPDFVEVVNFKPEEKWLPGQDSNLQPSG
jgi:hypothetical protein